MEGMGKMMSQHKAKMMMKEGKARGHKLTKKQKGLFGIVAGGKTPTRFGASRRRR